MSRPLRERLVELNRDTEPVRLAPAAEVRARGRQRARRRLAGTAVGVTALVAAAGFGVVNLLGPGGTPAPVATLPAGSPSSCPFPVDLTLPDSPGDVDIEVYAGALLVDEVIEELDGRGFSATGHPMIDLDSGSAGTVAVIRYGPRAVGDATVVQALVGDDAVMRFSPDRDGRAVDLVIGPKFRRLATTTEMNRSLVDAGVPTRPPGC